MSRGLFTPRIKNKWVHGISVELQTHNCLSNVTALEESSWSFNFQFWISISRLEQVSAYLAGENNVRVMCNKYSYFVKILVSENANEARLIVLMGYNNIFFSFSPSRTGLAMGSLCWARARIHYCVPTFADLLVIISRNLSLIVRSPSANSIITSRAERLPISPGRAVIGTLITTGRRN